MNHELMWISEPNSGLSNFGIQYIGDNTDEFERVVRSITLMEKNTFEQGTQGNWKYFEFFTSSQDWILEVCFEVSRRMNLDLMNREPNRQDLGLE